MIADKPFADAFMCGGDTVRDSLAAQEHLREVLFLITYGVDFYEAIEMLPKDRTLEIEKLFPAFMAKHFPDIGR